MATVRWTPTGNNVQSFVFLTGLVFTALLAGVVVRALRSQLDWLAERAAAPGARARPAGVAGGGDRAGPHRAGDARRRLAQHPGDGDAGRRRLPGAGLGPGPGGGGHPRGLEHRAPGADRHAADARRAAGRAGAGAAGAAARRAGAGRADGPARRWRPSRACASSRRSSSGCAAPGWTSRSSARACPSRSPGRRG